MHFLGLRLNKENITTKKTKDKLIKWIKDVLNEKNGKYYRNNNKLSKKVKHMNDIVQGFANYIRYYHPEDAFKIVNNEIKHKKHNRKFLKLQEIKNNIITAVIPVSEWQKLFR